METWNSNCTSTTNAWLLKKVLSDRWVVVEVGLDMFAQWIDTLKLRNGRCWVWFVSVRPPHRRLTLRGLLLSLLGRLVVWMRSSGLWNGLLYRIQRCWNVCGIAQSRKWLNENGPSPQPGSARLGPQIWGGDLAVEGRFWVLKYLPKVKERCVRRDVRQWWSDWSLVEVGKVKKGETKCVEIWFCRLEECFEWICRLKQ